MATNRTRFLAFTTLVGVLALPLAAGTGETPSASIPSSQDGRVIVLGMDGMDAAMISDWMDAGQLPNFARMRDQGTFAPLMPGNPAQSPVSWATLNTGRNPGKHGIFDFVRVKRENGTPRPDIGFQEIVQRDIGGTPMPTATAAADASGSGGSPEDGGASKPLIPALGAAGAGILLMLLLLAKSKGLAMLLGIVGVGAGAALYVMGGDEGGSSGGGDGASAERVVLKGEGSAPETTFKDYDSLLQAEEWWMELDRAGIPFRGHGTIVSYPVKPMQHGKVVAGLGAPDAKGSLNSWAVYTTQDERRRVRKKFDPVPASSLDDGTPWGEASGDSAGSGVVYRLDEKSPGVYTSKLTGPRNQFLYDKYRAERTEVRNKARTDPDFKAREKELADLFRNSRKLDTYVDLEVKWTPGAESVELTVDGTTQTVAVGSWSEFFEVTFPWTETYATFGLARVWVESDGEHLELYSSPVQIDPDKPTPGSQICWPTDFAAEVAERIGDFETLGWACQTHAVKDAELSDACFLADIEFTVTWREKMLKDAMADDSWKALFHFFGSPDRVCHMLMRHIDDKHPQHVPELADEEYDFFGKKVKAKDTALAIYQRMDEVVGWMLDEGLAPGDRLIIVSDHGFDSFRREVSLNNWLYDSGFLAIQDTNTLGMPNTRRDLSRAGKTSMLRFIDWPRTKAYSIAIGKIYLNRVGREAGGIVSDEEADAVLDEIEAALLDFTDPDTGEKVVARVYRRDELYSGPYWDEATSGNGEGAAELTIDFVEGYRAAWTTTGGGMKLVDATDEDGVTKVTGGETVYDNMVMWSGDHCGVDIHAVQGIFFSNAPLGLPAGDEHYDATHLAPTVLSMFGVDAPEDYDRAALTTSAP